MIELIERNQLCDGCPGGSIESNVYAAPFVHLMPYISCFALNSLFLCPYVSNPLKHSLVFYCCRNIAIPRSLFYQAWPQLNKRYIQSSFFVNKISDVWSRFNILFKTVYPILLSALINCMPQSSYRITCLSKQYEQFTSYVPLQYNQALAEKWMMQNTEVPNEGRTCAQFLLSLALVPFSDHTRQTFCQASWVTK